MPNAVAGFPYCLLAHSELGTLAGVLIFFLVMPPPCAERGGLAGHPPSCRSVSLGCNVIGVLRVFPIVFWLKLAVVFLSFLLMPPPCAESRGICALAALVSLPVSCGCSVGSPGSMQCCGVTRKAGGSGYASIARFGFPLHIFESI